MVLKSLLSWFFPKPRVRIASPQSFVSLRNRLGLSSVVVLGADIGDGVPLGDRSDLIPKITEYAAQQQVFDGIHKFDLDGITFVPIFADAASAKEFCGAYVDLLSKIHAFRLFRVSGPVLASFIDDNDMVVFNSQNDDEVELTCEQSRELKRSLETGVAQETHFLSIALPIPGVEREITFSPNEK